MTGDTVAVEDPPVEEMCCLELGDRTPVIVYRAPARELANAVVFVGWRSTDVKKLPFWGPARDAMTREVLGTSGSEEGLSLFMETLEGIPRVVGNAQYIRYRRDPDRAEVACRVAEEFQGRGANRLLLHELALHARSAGIRWFTAVVMAENVVTRDGFLQAGFPYRVVRDGPVFLIELDIAEAVEEWTRLCRTRIGPIAPVG